MYNMDQFNLLDLDNDVLDIIGGYVKADNNIREFNELIKKEIFDYVDKKMKTERKEARDGKYYISRSYKRELIWVYFVKFCRNHFDFEYILDNDNCVDITKIYNEYLTIKKLNLKTFNH